MKELRIDDANSSQRFDKYLKRVLPEAGLRNTEPYRKAEKKRNRCETECVYRANETGR